jgi:hypothetical protein
MAINIKEIFDGDSQAQQIDKINYNFDQILANGGGPIGATGAQGASGGTGSTGPQGAQGPIGPKGDPGDYTDFFVGDALASSTYSGTIFTKTEGGRPSNIVIGDLTATSINSPAPYGASSIKFVSDSYLGKIIRFDTNGNDSNYIDVVFKDNGSARTLDFLSSAVGSDVVYGFNGKGLDLNFNGSSFIDFNKDGSLIDTDVNFNSGNTVEFNGNVEFNDPNVVDPTGKVIMATNSNGAFEWGEASVVPIGTMVMVPAFVLNNTSKVLGWLAGSGGGAGKGVNDWAGWYYCWGATWSGGGNSYVTPDMRSRFPVGWDIQNAGSSSAPSAIAGATSGSNTSNVTISVPDHTHTVSAPQYQSPLQDPSDSNVYFNAGVGIVTGADGGFNQTKSVAITPLATTVGYMIYLGADNLTHN